MLDIKNTIPKMKQAFDGLISRLGMAEKSSELVDMSIQTHKMDKYRGKKKNWKIQNRMVYPRAAGQLQKL